MAPDLFLRNDSALYHYDSSIIMYTLLFSVSKYYHEINIKCNTQRNQYFHFFFIMTHLFDIIHRRWFLTFDHKGDLLYELWKERFEETPGRTDFQRHYVRQKMRVIFCKVLLVCCFAVAIIGGSLGFGVYKGILDSAPSIDDIDATPTGYLTTVLDNQGNEIATLVASGSNRKM